VKLVERDRELASLVSALDRARHGRGTTVLVSGEAGIGKSTLLAAFAERISDRARVYRGTCEDMLTPRPLGPFQDIARAAGAGWTDRDAVIDALLAEMAFTQRPAVVIVEDVQWGDQASIDVLRFLVRRVAGLPALLVATYRTEELPAAHPLLRVVAAIPTESVLRLPLPHLSDLAVAELAMAAGADPGPVVAAVGGNPFYLSEVLAAPSESVPASVLQAVQVRVAALPPQCRAALEVLSVLPTEAEQPLLDALFPVQSVLDPAEAMGVLLPSVRGMRFRHELARRAVESSLTRSRRRAAHTVVLEALAAIDADPSRLVHHAVAVADDAAIAQYAVLALAPAQQARAHREVARFAELALAHGAHTGPERADLHGLAARARYALNEFGAAASHADRAVELWDADRSAPLALGEALLISARMSSLVAEPGPARSKATRAVKVLEPLGPSRVLALAYSTMGAQNAVQTQFARALTWTDRALGLAAEVDAQDVRSHALGYRGVAKVSSGDESGYADLREAIAIAERLDHAEYLTVSAHNLAVMYLRAVRVQDAAPLLERAAEVAREHNLDTAWFRIEAQRCQCLILQGHWQAAEHRLRALVGGAADPGANAVNPLAFLGRLLARRGDSGAAGLVERAWALATATGEDQKLAVAAGARLEHRWLTCDAETVLAEGEALRQLAIRAGHRFLHAEVLRYLRRAGAAVDPFPGCPPAFAAGIRGDWAEAAHLWAEAGVPYERALELSESGDPAALREALAVLDGLGARATAQLIRRHARRAGVQSVPRGPRTSTRVNPGRLTDRQLEVLTLVAEGRTNAEIAERLVLSRRTVDNHVAAVLRALGVGSRRDVPRAAAALGMRR
jgi:DNA-binding CsgD family transcriptional regulator/tetratricopeptide (TPR) repeat protein